MKRIVIIIICLIGCTSILIFGNSRREPYEKLIEAFISPKTYDEYGEVTIKSIADSGYTKIIGYEPKDNIGYFDDYIIDASVIKNTAISELLDNYYRFIDLNMVSAVKDIKFSILSTEEQLEYEKIICKAEYKYVSPANDCDYPMTDFFEINIDKSDSKELVKSITIMPESSILRDH